MASAQPAADHTATDQAATDRAMGESPMPATDGSQVVEVAPEELNQWKRGFTPQAEIWNGRLAMVGLSVGLTVLLIARLTGRV